MKKVLAFALYILQASGVVKGRRGVPPVRVSSSFLPLIQAVDLRT